MTVAEVFMASANNPLPLIGLACAPVQLNWHVGDVVRKLREERHWTQTRLAKAAAVNKGSVVRVEENATGIKRETYEKIAHALGVRVRDLHSLVPTSDDDSPRTIELRKQKGGS